VTHALRNSYRNRRNQSRLSKLALYGGDTYRVSTQGQSIGNPFASEHDKSWEQVRLAFMQRLSGDMAGAKVTGEHAPNTPEQPSRRSDRVATNGL